MSEHPRCHACRRDSAVGKTRRSGRASPRDGRFPDSRVAARMLALDRRLNPAGVIVDGLVDTPLLLGLEGDGTMATRKVCGGVGDPEDDGCLAHGDGPLCVRDCVVKSTQDKLGKTLPTVMPTWLTKANSGTMPFSLTPISLFSRNHELAGPSSLHPARQRLATEIR